MTKSSPEIKQHVLDLYKSGKPINDIKDMYRVSYQACYNWIKELEPTLFMARKLGRPGRPRKNIPTSQVIVCLPEPNSQSSFIRSLTKQELMIGRVHGNCYRER